MIKCFISWNLILRILAIYLDIFISFDVEYEKIGTSEFEKGRNWGHKLKPVNISKSCRTEI